MLGIKFYLVDLRGNVHYHVAIVLSEWLPAYLDPLICEIFSFYILSKLTINMTALLLV